MNNICKYKSILELEKKYENSFSLCKTNKIALLPPVLKKIGYSFFLSFLVIEEPTNTSNSKEIKRPIGLININTKNKKEIIYDFKNYDICPKNYDFNLVYYSIDDNNNFWPIRNFENEEKYRICLDNIQKLLINTRSKQYNIFYEDYLNKVKMLFPTNYWEFYEHLQNKDIFEINNNIYEKRKLANEKFLVETEKRNILTEKLLSNKKNVFKEKFLNDIYIFCKKEIIPLLKGKGSYSKLKFFDLMGEKIRETFKNINNYSNCYNPIYTRTILSNNYNNLLEKYQIEIIKLYSKACDNNYQDNIAIDTIGKVLLVFLNALLIEEKQGKAIDDFENEINECISIFEEDSHRITNTEIKNYLTKIYKNLRNDYYTAEEEKLSNIYIAYVNINNM